MLTCSLFQQETPRLETQQSISVLFHRDRKINLVFNCVHLLLYVVNYCFAAGVRDINKHMQHARGAPQETTASVKIKGKARGITGDVAF